jgi:hypothetical protein
MKEERATHEQAIRVTYPTDGRRIVLRTEENWDTDIEPIRHDAKRNIKIYLDSGWPGDNYEATRSMRDHLIWKGYHPGSELFYLAFPEAKHGENAWAERSPIPFQFLFGKLPAFPQPAN